MSWRGSSDDCKAMYRLRAYLLGLKDIGIPGRYGFFVEDLSPPLELYQCRRCDKWAHRGARHGTAIRKELDRCT